MPVPSLPESVTPQAAGVDFAGLMAPAKIAAVSGEVLLPAAPNRPFFLRHHPRAWRVSTTLEKPVGLPDVAMLPLEPGVNNIRTLRSGETEDAAYINAVQTSQRKGWVYLDPSAMVPAGCLPEGVPPGSYLRAVPCKCPLTGRRGERHLEAWNVPVRTMPGEAQRFSFDHHKYELWLQWLVESGQIQPMSKDVLESMRGRVRQHLERAEGLNVTDDVRKRMVAKRKAIVDNYEAAEPAQPKQDDEPKKSRSKS